MMAPIKPSQVLFGDILSNNLCLPNNFPQTKAQESEDQIKMSKPNSIL